jgi:dipeptidyl aminopeptidase/acylaminoacyl peptidase
MRRLLDDPITNGERRYTAMRKITLPVALVVTLILLGIALSGCGSSTTPTTPTPVLPPTVGAATPPMGAFIEGPVAFSTSGWIMCTATNDGSGLTRLSSRLRDFHSVYVLPDGSKAVFAAADGYSQIYYLAPVDSTTEPVQLTTTPLHKINVMLSADGSRIAFLQFSPVQTGDYPKWDVAVMDAHGSNLYVIPAPGIASFSHPYFSPDASKIVVAMGVAAFGADWDIYTMNADGTNLTRLTPDRFPGETPAFSPDGNQIVFGSTASGDSSVYIMNTDGSGLKRVGPQDSKWRDPLFVSDRIMFVASREIYSIKPDGTDLRQVTNNTLEDSFERNPAE